MNILNVRYSVNRKKEYQIKTIIFEENNRKYVSKEPYSDFATEHVKNIYNNYKLLDQSLMNLIEPSIEKNKIIFPFIEGGNFAQILINDINNGKSVDFKEKLLWYKSLLLKEEQIPFYETDNFKVIFGSDHHSLDGVNSFKVPNIDLNFENIILSENNEVNIIDYEWVFNFPIPVDYVIFRAISQFIDRYSSFVKDFITAEEVYSTLGISGENLSVYKEMETSFLNHVGSGWSEQRKHYFKPIIRKEEWTSNIFENISAQEEFIQVFWDDESSFNESDSVLVKVNEYNLKSIYEIDLPDNLINSLRIDPGNLPSYVKMRVFLSYGQQEIEITNALTFSNNINFLNKNQGELEFLTITNDPQLIFEDIFIQSGEKKLKIEFFIINESPEVSNLLFSKINKHKQITSDLKEKNKDLEMLVEIKENELKTKNNELIAKEAELLSKDEELQRITNVYYETISTKGWKMLKFIRKLKFK